MKVEFHVPVLTDFFVWLSAQNIAHVAQSLAVLVMAIAVLILVVRGPGK